MSVLDAVLVVGTAARLVRLGIVDTLSWRLVHDRIRPGSLSGFLLCAFCVGFWICVGVVGSYLAWGHTLAWLVVAGSLTLNYIVGHLHLRLDHRSE